MKSDRNRIFPFLPKSNGSLRPGDFWGMEFVPGRFAAGRVIELPWQHNDFSDRRWFLAGLMDWCGDAPPTSPDLENRRILEQGSMHVKAFAFSNWMISGNRDMSADGIKPRLVKVALIGNDVQEGLGDIRTATGKEASRLPLQCTWGDKVIEIIAQRRFLKPVSQSKPSLTSIKESMQMLRALGLSSPNRGRDPE